MKPFLVHSLFPLNHHSTCLKAPMALFNTTKGGANGKEPAYQCRRHRFNPWAGKIPWRRKWPPTPVSLPGKSHGQRGLMGYSPCGHKRVKYNWPTEQHKHELVMIPPIKNWTLRLILPFPSSVLINIPPTVGNLDHVHLSLCIICSKVA